MCLIRHQRMGCHESIGFGQVVPCRTRDLLHPLGNPLGHPVGAATAGGSCDGRAKARASCPVALVAALGSGAR